MALLSSILSISVLAGATVASAATPAAKAAPSIGLELSGKTWVQPVSAFLATAKKLGITTVVTRRDQWSSARHKELLHGAAAQRLTLVEPRPVPTSARAWSALDRTCRGHNASLERCAVATSSSSVAAEVAQTARVRVVVVHVATPASLVTLAKAKPRRARVVAILPRGAAGLSDRWQAAVTVSEKEGVLLAVAPAPSGAATTVSDFSALVGGNLKKVKTVGGTTAPPSTPAGFSRSAADAVSITVRWDAALAGGSAVGGYSLSRGGVQVATTTETSATLTGLTCATTYHVELVAFDASGNHSGVAALDAATTECVGGSGGGGGGGGGVTDVLPPSAPFALSANSLTQSGASLLWVASTDNVGIAGYGLYRNGTSIGSAGSTSYTVVGLACATTYTFAVDAFDAAGNRSVKTNASVTTLACGGATDTQAPTVPGGPTKGATTQTSVAVSWSASTDNVGVTGYGLYRNGTGAGSSGTTSSSFTGLTCGTSYSLAVDAVDGAGNRSAKATITAATAACSDTQAPSVPGGPAAGATTQTSVAVSWSASTDNVGVTGYGLYRNGTSAGSTASTSSTFTGLACGTSYSLAVDAVDAAANRSAKATVTASTAACPGDTQAPSVPAGYSVGTVTQTSIPMSWSAATDNVAVTGYGIYMTGVLVTSTSSLSYSYTGLTCGTNYTLAVDAVDAAGNRSAKATAIVGSAACSAPPPSGNANLWVDTNGGSCARQASAGAYVDASACSSFGAAYSAAQCGDTVGVRPGTYGSQNVSSGSKSCTSATPVTITSVPGGTCTDNTTAQMPSLSSSVSYVTFACMDSNTGTNSCGGTAGSSGQHSSIVWNTYDHMDILCAFYDSDHLRVTNSTFGPVNTCSVAQEDMIDFRANSDNIQDVVFDGVTFKTVTAPPDFQCGAGEHVDSMQGYGMANLVVKNSTFYGCPGQCVIFRPFSGGVPGPLTFENDVFNEPQDPGGALSLGTSSPGDACGGLVLVQNNTFVNGANMNGGYTTGAGCSMVIRNNIFGGSFFCNLSGSLDSYTNNVFLTGSACGTGGKACTPLYVAPLSSPTSNGNYHLQSADTCAKGAASQTPGTYPATDFDGQARPQGSVDAGVDEIP